MPLTSVGILDVSANLLTTEANSKVIVLRRELEEAFGTVTSVSRCQGNVPLKTLNDVSRASHSWISHSSNAKKETR